jgi:hypothetical protein
MGDGFEWHICKGQHWFSPAVALMGKQQNAGGADCVNEVDFRAV